MAVYSVINRKDSQALPGAAVLVTLNAADAGQLANWSEGDLCTATGSGNTGLISRVDYEGDSFTVMPIQPDKTFDSGVYGYLGTGETVQITY